MTKKPVRIVVPDDVQFKDLQLFRDVEGNVRYNPDAMNKVIEASGVDPGMLLDWSNLSTLLVVWHEVAVKGGQPPDPVMEELMVEVMEEMRREVGWSGRA
jgi:hypothetical protein